MLVKVAEQTFPLAGWEFEVFQDDDGQYCFHGATVCDYFKLKNPSVMIQRHVDEDWRFRAPVELGKGLDAWMVKEPGLYQLAFVAKTAMAKKFQRWVFDEVLPKLRETGLYKIKSRFSDEINQQIEELVAKNLEAQNTIAVQSKKIRVLEREVEEYEESAGELRQELRRSQRQIDQLTDSMDQAQKEQKMGDLIQEFISESGRVIPASIFSKTPVNHFNIVFVRWAKQHHGIEFDLGGQGCRAVYAHLQRLLPEIDSKREYYQGKLLIGSVQVNAKLELTFSQSEQSVAYIQGIEVKP